LKNIFELKILLTKHSNLKNYPLKKPIVLISNLFNTVIIIKIYHSKILKNTSKIEYSFLFQF